MIRCDAAREITPNIRLALALAMSADRMPGEILVSPLLGTRDIDVASLGVTYHWPRIGHRTAP